MSGSRLEVDDPLLRVQAKLAERRAAQAAGLPVPATFSMHEPPELEAPPARPKPADAAVATRAPRPVPRRPEWRRKDEARKAAHGASAGGPELTSGLGFTARAVLMLAPDLDLSTHDIVYTALWAPRVAARMAYQDTPTAFLSREELSAATGLRGQTLMAPGGAAERTSRTVGLVRMVARGIPGAVPLGGDQGWRGTATEWTLTRPLPDFEHTPARTGEPRSIRTLASVEDIETDPRALDVWLDPMFEWWSGDAARHDGLRLVATLIRRYGMTDLSIGSADVVGLLEVERTTAWRILRRLEAVGIAAKAERGRWEVRLGSYLGRLTADDLKHHRRRPARPHEDRAELWDWSWFDPDGRSTRATARDVGERVATGALDVRGGPLEPYSHQRRGVIIALVELFHGITENGRRLARAVLGPAVASRAQEPTPRLSRAPGAPVAASGAPPAPSAPAAPGVSGPTEPTFAVDLYPELRAKIDALRRTSWGPTPTNVIEA